MTLKKLWTKLEDLVGFPNIWGILLLLMELILIFIQFNLIISICEVDYPLSFCGVESKFMNLKG